MSGKVVVFVVYGRGIFGGREIEVGLERDVGFLLLIIEIERVREWRRVGFVLNLGFIFVIFDLMVFLFWKFLKGFSFLVKV